MDTGYKTCIHFHGDPACIHAGIIYTWIYIPSVIMLFAFCQWFHKGAFWKNALISVIVVLAIYFIFKNFLNVPIDFGMFSI